MKIWPEYPAHEFHTVAAKPRSELWRLLLGVVGIVSLYLALALIYQQAIVAIWSDEPGFRYELITGSSPRAMYALLFSFGLITLSVFLVVQTLHGRSPLSVMGPLILAVPQFIRVTAMLAGLGVLLMVLPPYGYGEPLVPALAPGLWGLLLPFSLVAVFVQISAEEIFFRGYLQQQLGARFRSPLVWMVLPSTLFAIGHSTTMLLGVYFNIGINSYIIDAIIGLSVVYKALDNMGAYQRWFGFQPNTKAATFIFGLFHGFGLAAKIQEFEIARDGLLPNLLAFNVGVEIGQLLALGAILIAMGFWRHTSSFTRHGYNANVALMTGGFIFVGYQMAGFFIS